MSTKQIPPRQDRRNKGRSCVMPHDGVKSVGTHKSDKTILDPRNGDPFSDNGGSAPGANGPAETED